MAPARRLAAACAAAFACAGGPERKAIPAEHPSPERPVVAEALVDPDRVAPGETFALRVRVRIAPSWHIAASDEEGEATLPTRLELELPEDLEAAGPWSRPAPRPNPDGGEPVYMGEATFERSLRIGEAAAFGNRTIRCRLLYQACDPFVCLPPEAQEFEIRIEIGSKKGGRG